MKGRHIWTCDPASRAALARELMEYKVETPEPSKVTVYADVELHTDGSLHLDGMGFQRGEEMLAFIHPHEVEGFLAECAKIHKRLKERKLFLKPSGADKEKA